MVKLIRHFMIFSLPAILLATSMIYATTPDMIGITNATGYEQKTGCFEIKGVILNNGQIRRVAVKTGIGPWVDAVGVESWSYTVNSRQIVLNYEDVYDPVTGQYIQKPVYGPYYGALDIVIGAFDAGGNEVAQKMLSVTIIPEKPYSDIISGVYSGPLNVILKAAPEVTTYYTTDGTDPKTNGMVYGGAISVRQDTVIKAVAKSADNQYSEISILDIQVNPATPPVFQIQYYEDQDFSRPLPDPVSLKAGTYYLKIVSDRKYSSGPFIHIDAPGNENDVSNAVLTPVSDCVYQYTRIVTDDPAAVGGTRETITISGTDDNGNYITNTTPINSTLKAADLDTQPPASGSIALAGGISSTNDPTPQLEISSTGADQMRLALSEAGLANAPWVQYAAQYDQFDISEGGQGDKTLWIEFKDRAGNIQTQHAFTTVYFDNTVLLFDIEYFSDSGLTQTLGNNPVFKEGTYYLKITANQDVSIIPALQINAEGTGNDVSSGVATMVNSRIFYFTRTIVADSAAVGEVREQITIQGITPSNIDLKAAYTDTQAPDAPVVTGPVNTTKLRPVWSWNDVAGAVKYRYNFSDGADWKETVATSFTPDDNLEPDHQYTLSVQAGDQAGNWSSSGSFTITVSAAPLMSLRQGTTDIVNGGNYDFGNVALGAGTYATTFTIQNTGTADLNLTGTPKVEISGNDAASFVVLEYPLATVAAGGSTTFKIRCVPNNTGPKTAMVSIISNDPAGTPYTFAITANGTLEGTLALDTWTVGNISAPYERKTYCLQTTPGTTYAITWDDAPYGSGAYSCDILVSIFRQDLTATYVKYENYHFWAITALDNVVYISVYGNNNTSTGNFALKAYVYEPIMAVIQGTTSIANNTGNYDFGDVSLCTGKEVSFTIQNNGNNSLRLTGSPYVQIGGPDAACFSVTEQPLSNYIFDGGAKSFSIKFTPSGAGVKTATVTIPNDDHDQDPYVFTITGTGTGSFTPLTLENWATGKVSYSSDVKLYSFAATPGTDYAISWNDSVSGSGTYTGNVKVSAFRQDMITTYFSDMDDGYYIPRIITAQDDMVYIRVMANSSSTTGSFAVRASLSEPVINVTLGTTGINIPNGTGSYSYGPVTINTSGDANFTIDNYAGDAVLHLTDNPRVRISGPDADCFSVTTQPNSSIPLSSSSNFVVRFSPTSTGTKTATVSIASDDPHLSTYIFTVTGYGAPVIEKVLSFDSWTEGNIATAGEDKYYSFYVTAGRRYAIVWDDSRQGSGAYTGDITVSAYRNDYVTPYFTSIDSGYETPSFITAQGNLVYLRIAGLDGAATGSFALKVVEVKIYVKQGTTDIFSGTGSYDYGNVNVGSSGSATFTIQNIGSALNLTGSPKVQISGADASCFTVTAQPDSPVMWHTNATFTVTFTPSGVGTRTATISIANDAPCMNPYTFTVIGTGAATNLKLGDWTPGKISIQGEVKCFYFNATPGSTYAIAWDDSYQGSGAYYCNVKVSAYRQDLTTAYFSNIDSGYSTPRIITAQESLVYIKVVGLYTTSTGTFALKVCLNKPAINIQQGTTIIPNGAGSYDYGNVSPGSSSYATFTIQNTGTLNLNLTGSPKVQLSGADASCFSVTTQPSSPVAANASTTFTIKFTPAGSGAKTAIVNIANDDTANDPYTFTITGTPFVETLTPGVWTAGNISASGEVKMYMFSATAGKQYAISWDDRYQGSNIYSCDIKVSAYREDLTTTYFSNIDSGYTTPKTITAQDGIVYIKVAGYSSSNTGSYALKVTEVN